MIITFVNVMSLTTVALPGNMHNLLMKEAEKNAAHILLVNVVNVETHGNPRKEEGGGG